MSTKSRNYCLTVYDFEEIVNFTHDSLKYSAYAEETCPSTGRKHKQAFIIFKYPVTFTAVKKLFPTSHIEQMRGSFLDNEKYCSKEGQLIEHGEKPASQKRKGEMEQDRWEEIKRQAIEGNLDEIDPKVYITHYKALKEIKKDHMTKPADLETVCGHWYYGESGKGKTTTARTENPGAYIKSRDKWWDGYQNEEVVILDDFDPFHKGLAALLKDWADKWTFKAETKGGYMWIRPKKFIITSQYHYTQIYEDKETLEALDRRYTLKHFQ